MLCRIARVIATHPDGTRRDGSNRTVDPPAAAPRLANRRSASSRVAASPSPSCTRAALDVDVASSSLAITRNRAPRRASSARAPVASSYRARSPKLTKRSLARRVFVVQGATGDARGQRVRPAREFEVYHRRKPTTATRRRDAE